MDWSAEKVLEIESQTRNDAGDLYIGQECNGAQHAALDIFGVVLALCRKRLTHGALKTRY